VFVDKPRGMSYERFREQLNRATSPDAPAERDDTLGPNMTTRWEEGLDQTVSNPRDEASGLDAEPASPGAWWLRQLVLGPGPEAIVVTNGSVAVPIATVHRAPCEVIDARW
jgi:hypothetical protein